MNLKIMLKRLWPSLTLCLLFFILLLTNIIPSINATTNVGKGLRIAVFSLLTIGLVVYSFLKKRRPNVILFSAIMVLVISSIVLSITIGNTTTIYDVTMDVSLVSRLKNILYPLEYLIMVFGFLFVVKDEIKEKHINLHIFYYFIIAISLIALIYSFITEWDMIVNLLTVSSPDHHAFPIKSFFENKNAYGLFMTFGVLATIYFLLGEKKFKHQKLVLIITLVLLCIGLLLSIFKGGIVAIILVGIFYYVKYVINSLKNKKYLCLISLSIILILFTFIMLLLNIPQMRPEGSLFNKIFVFLDQKLWNSAIDSLQIRFDMIARSGILFTNPLCYLGFGGSLVTYQYSALGIYAMDNYFIHSFYSGGIILISILIYLYARAFMGIKYIKDNKYKYFFLCSTIVMIICSLFENFGHLNVGIFGILMMLFSFTPIEAIKENE